jgi:hypothetical protein
MKSPIAALGLVLLAASSAASAQSVEIRRDVRRIGAWGGSSGGHLVELLGTMDGNRVGLARPARARAQGADDPASRRGRDLGGVPLYHTPTLRSPLRRERHDAAGAPGGSARVARGGPESACENRRPRGH